MNRDRDKKRRLSDLVCALLGTLDVADKLEGVDEKTVRDIGQLALDTGYSREGGAINAIASKLEAAKKLTPRQHEMFKEHLLSLEFETQRTTTTSIVRSVLNTIGVIAAVLTILTTLNIITPADWSALKKSDPGDDGQASQFFLVYLFQMSLIIVVLFEVHSRCRKFARLRNTDAESHVIGQFGRYYMMAWVSWLALYSCLAVSAQIQDGPVRTLLLVVAELSNIVTSFAFVLCFATLDAPSVEKSRGDARDRPFRRMRLIAALAASAIALFTIFITYLWSDFLEANPAWQNASRLPSAVFAGIAMCYFVGRIDSKQLKIPRLLIGILYGYCVLQLAWPLIESKPAARSGGFFPVQVIQIIVLLSLVGKIVLWRAVDSIFARDQLRFRRYIRTMQLEMSEEDKLP